MEEDLLSDLIDYRKSKDKGVVTASRGLLQLFREVNPGLLKKRERGKAATMGAGITQVPEYGHSREKVEAIDGLDLLEDHFAAMRKEANGGVSDDEIMEEDDEAGWENWDVESDGGSDSSGWNDVSDDEKDLELSDSDDDAPKKLKRKLDDLEHDEAPEKKKGKRATRKEDEAEKRNKVARRGMELEKGQEQDVEMEDADDDDSKSVVSIAPSAMTEASASTKKLSLLAQQKILTPADFVMLNELRLKAAQDLVNNGGGGSGAKRKLAALEASKRHVGDDEANRFLAVEDILGPKKKTKADYEERMESIKKGREGRDKFGSSKGKKTKEVMSSSTNREKTRNKPLMMALQYVFRLVQ